MLEFCTSVMSKGFVPYLAGIILDQMKAPVNRQVTTSATLIAMLYSSLKRLQQAKFSLDLTLV